MLEGALEQHFPLPKEDKKEKEKQDHRFQPQETVKARLL